MDQIGFMYSQIRHHPKHGLLFVKKPGIRLTAPGFRTSMSIHRIKGQDFTDVTSFNPLSCFHMSCCKPLILSDHQLFAVAFCRFHHGLTFFQGNSHGLLTEYMESVIESLNGHGRMQGIGHADADRIQSAVQKCFQIRKSLSSVSFRHFFRFPRCHGIKCRQFAMFICRKFRNMPYLGNGAAAYNSYF